MATRASSRRKASSESNASTGLEETAKRTTRRQTRRPSPIPEEPAIVEAPSRPPATPVMPKDFEASATPATRVATPAAAGRTPKASSPGRLSSVAEGGAPWTPQRIALAAVGGIVLLFLMLHTPVTYDDRGQVLPPTAMPMRLVTNPIDNINAFVYGIPRFFSSAAVGSGSGAALSDDLRRLVAAEVSRALDEQKKSESVDKLRKDVDALTEKQAATSNDVTTLKQESDSVDGKIETLEKSSSTTQKDLESIRVLVNTLVKQQDEAKKTGKVSDESIKSLHASIDEKLAKLPNPPTLAELLAKGEVEMRNWLDEAVSVAFKTRTGPTAADVLKAGEKDVRAWIEKGIEDYETSHEKPLSKEDEKRVRDWINEAVNSVRPTPRAVHGGKQNGAVSRDEIEEMIRTELDTFAADRTGKTDWALTGHIVDHSATHHANRFENGVLSAISSMAESLFTGIDPKASAVLHPSNALGDCWPMHGSSGYIDIQLAAPVNITEVSVEHAPAAVVHVKSAPRVYKVWSVVNGASEHLYGEFEYRDGAGAIQTSKVQNVNTKELAQTVRFEIVSNHGADYTCLYRLRVHSLSETA